MSRNDELLTIDFWQDSDRIVQYCQSILTYVRPDKVFKVEVKFAGDRAFVDSTKSYGQSEITIPTIDPLKDLTSQIRQRSAFLRHELAHIIYSNEIDSNKLPCSYQLFNYLEDIRIEKKFSNAFKGTFVTFKTMRYIQFKKTATFNILNYYSMGNFFAFMIYRSYGFEFPNVGILIDYEKSFMKVKHMFDDTSFDNYVQIAKILLQEFKDIFPENIIQPKPEKPNSHKITKQDIEDEQLDEEIIEDIAPELLENERPKFDDYDFEDDDEYEDIEYDYDESSIDDDMSLKKGFSKESDDDDSELEGEFSFENDDEEKSTSRGKPQQFDDDDELPEPKEEDVQSTFSFKKNADYNILFDFKNNVLHEIENATFDLVSTPKFIDMQELLDCANVYGKTLPFDSKHPILMQTYNQVKQRNQKSILDLSIFLRRKTQNKIIHKIKPFQLDGEVDESNIADIFCSKEPRIFKNESYYYAPKNKIIVLLDCSGSMFSSYNGGKMLNAIEVLIQLFEASRLAKFEMEVYGFTDTTTTCEQKRKANIINFCKKYNLQPYEFEKGKEKKRIVLRVDLPGSMVMRILDTTLLKGENDLYAKKCFLANLYLASGSKSGEHAFYALSGYTPEVQSMAMMQRIIKKQSDRSSLFVINDGMYSDSRCLNVRSSQILKNRGTYASLIYAPEVIDDFLYFQDNYNFTLFEYTSDAMKYFCPDIYQAYTTEKKNSKEYEADLVKHMRELAVASRDLLFKINEQINAKIKNYANYQDMLSIFGYEVIQPMKEAYENCMLYTEHNFKIGDGEFKFCALMVVDDKNRRLSAIKTIPLTAKNIFQTYYKFEFRQLEQFLKKMIDLIDNQIDNLVYKSMIKKIGCKAITIGIQSECGAKYNDDFVFVDKALKAGTAIAKELKEIW